MPSEGRVATRSSPSFTDFCAQRGRDVETGKCSGTMYCGDHGHYDFMGRIFELSRT